MDVADRLCHQIQQRTLRVRATEVDMASHLQIQGAAPQFSSWSSWDVHPQSDYAAIGVSQLGDLLPDVSVF